MKKLALHWKILIGMVIGILFGLIMTKVDGGKSFIGDWIKPFGTIFVNLLTQAIFFEFPAIFFVAFSNFPKGF